MKEESIRKYAKLMKELDLTALELTEGTSVVRLERSSASLPARAQAEILRPFDAQSAPAPVSAPEQPDEPAVLSPMVGVFYSAPAENAEAFVKVGDHVKKGDTLCIIEAMKLMNEITAERDGVVTQILAENGQTVEYGTPLFRIGGQ